MSNALRSRHNAGSLRQQAAATGRTGERKKFSMAVGRFDFLRFGPKGVWVRFNPRAESQYYCYDIYDRDAGAVKSVSTLWYYHVNHFIGGKAPVVCSSGAGRDKPCWGCASVEDHWNKVRAKENELRAKGIQMPKEAKKSAVSSDPTFDFSVTIMETMYARTLLDEHGNVRVNKRGEPLTNFVPRSLMPKDLTGAREAGFGRRAHVSVSERGLEQLLDLDDYFCGRHCANDASEMTIIDMTCPQCEEAVGLEDGLVGEEAAEAMMDKGWVCQKCNHAGQFTPVFVCPTCDKPTPGNLTCFDVRMKSQKTEGEKGGRLMISKLRMPKIPDEEVATMISTPLELEKIFAPTDLQWQAKALGDRIKGLQSPLVQKRDGEKEAPPTSPYDEEEETEAEADDVDDATF